MLHKASRSFLSILLLLTVPVGAGCSRQSEGERCSLTNGDSDCNDGLECTEAAKLRNRDGVDRCCPESGNATDERCELDTTGGDGDSLSGGGAGGMSSDDDGPASLGDKCDYNSDCQSPLVCGPQGECQPECNQTRDCPDGEVCNEDQVCVAE